MAKRDAEAYHQAIHGERAGDPSEGDDMGHIVLGDMKTEYHPGPTPNPSKPSNWPKALLGAGLLAAGVGGPLGAYFVADALRQKPEKVQIAPPKGQQSEAKPSRPGAEKIIDWKVGDPIVE